MSMWVEADEEINGLFLFLNLEPLGLAVKLTPEEGEKFLAVLNDVLKLEKVSASLAPVYEVEIAPWLRLKVGQYKFNSSRKYIRDVVLIFDWRTLWGHLRAELNVTEDLRGFTEDLDRVLRELEASAGGEGDGGDHGS